MILFFVYFCILVAFIKQAWHAIAYTPQLDTHVGTLSQTLVTQLVLRPCVLDKNLCVDGSSNFLSVSFYANIRYR